MKRRGLAVALVVMCVLVLAASASAAQRYASPSGTANSGCSQTTPCDIVTAINNASNNDEVVVEPGSYYKLGTASTPLTDPLGPTLFLAVVDIHGVPGEPRPQIFSSANIELSLDASGSTVSDLDIEGSGAYGVYLNSGATGTQLVVVDTAASGAVACQIFGTLIDSVCDATGTHAAAESFGANCSGPLTATIADSDLYATGADSVGVSVGSLAGSCSLTVDLSDSIVRGGAGGFDVQAFRSAGSGSETITASNSDYVTTSLGAAATATMPGTAGNITADPALVNAAAGDFHETAGSPTIDAGLTSAANGMLDFEGQPRTEGGLTDIGADEYIAVPIVAGAAPSGVTNAGAMLNGTLNPGHDLTSYAFHYGTTAALGSATAAATLPPGLSSVPVSAAIGGLRSGTQYFWMLTSTNTVGSSATAVASFETSGPPALTALTLGSSTFRAAGSGASIAKAKKPKPQSVPVGTAISYSVTEPTTTTLTVTRRRRGVKRGKRCVAPPQHASGTPAKHCIRLVTLGTFRHQDSDGANSFEFTGRVNGHKLKQGAYQLNAVPISPTAVKGIRQTISFHISG